MNRVVREGAVQPRPEGAQGAEPVKRQLGEEHSGRRDDNCRILSQGCALVLEEQRAG